MKKEYRVIDKDEKGELRSVIAVSNDYERSEFLQNEMTEWFSKNSKTDHRIVIEERNISDWNESE